MADLTFITGMGRTGSTWFSKLVAASLGAQYFHEAFRFKYDPEGYKRFTRVMIEDNDDRGIWEYIQDKFPNGPIVIKDFTIRFAASYLKRRGANVFIIVRHPYPWMSSIIRNKHNPHLFPYGERIIVEHFPHLRSHIEKHSDSIEGILAIRYGVLHSHLISIQGFPFVRHEDLCLNPAKAFSNVGLNFNEAAQNIYDHHNQPGHKPYLQTRLSEKEPFKWQGYLDQKKYNYIFKVLEPFGILDHLGYQYVGYHR